jgi:hypothetical protein
MLRATRRDQEEAIRREREMKIPCFNADRYLYTKPNTEFPGYNGPVRYAFPPRTRYQKRVRNEANDKVTYQYTRRFNEKIIERCECFHFLYCEISRLNINVVRAWNVPLRGNADHTGTLNWLYGLPGTVD